MLLLELTLSEVLSCYSMDSLTLGCTYRYWSAHRYTIMIVTSVPIHHRVCRGGGVLSCYSMEPLTLGCTYRYWSAHRYTIMIVTSVPIHHRACWFLKKKTNIIIRDRSFLVQIFKSEQCSYLLKDIVSCQRGGSPTNRSGSDKTRGQGSFGPSTGVPDLQGSLQPAELDNHLDINFKKERTAHLIRFFLLRQGEPGTSQ